MNNEQINTKELKVAVHAALDGAWDTSHNIAQNHKDTSANWLHAVLHKIEGDEWNSQYWYNKTSGITYDKFTDVTTELLEILESLNQ